MRHRAEIWLVALAMAAVPAGCQTAPPATAPAPSAVAMLAGGPGQEQRAAPAPIDWAGAGDCRDQLALLHDLAARGRLDQAQAPPFAIAPATPASGLEWVRSTPVPLLADLPLDAYEDEAAAAAAAPCLLLVEQSGAVRAAHRVVDLQTVASEYQSGVHAEKNPDYDLAQARLREAERENKRRGRSILSVGDPMLDLVGLVVGGVIAAFDQVGSDDSLEDALAALKETPRSREQPVYRAYAFERSTVRAGKEATIAIALRDLRRGHVWRAEVRQREMRELAILEGLDPRDRDYEQHRAGAMSPEEFAHWQRQPPQLPMSALVAALVGRGGPESGRGAGHPELLAAAPAAVGPVDWPAAAEPEAEGGTARLPGMAALEPGAGPAIAPRQDQDRAALVQDLPLAVASPGDRQPPTAPGRATIAAALDPRLASVVRLEAGGRRGQGLYLRPRLVVTTADLVGGASVVDVTTSDGAAALGLVVHTDAERGLAVVHVPRAGQPALPTLAPAAAGRMVDVLELIEPGQARLTRAMLRGGMSAPALQPAPEAGTMAAIGAAPVFLDDRVVGLFATPDGAGRLVPIEALEALLEDDALAALR